MSARESHQVEGRVSQGCGPCARPLSTISLVAANSAAAVAPTIAATRLSIFGAESETSKRASLGSRTPW